MCERCKFLEQINKAQTIQLKDRDEYISELRKALTNIKNYKCFMFGELEDDFPSGVVQGYRDAIEQITEQVIDPILKSLPEKEV